MKKTYIQIIERNGQYCVRFKRGFFTGWFWKYTGYDGWQLTPSWSTNSVAEYDYKTMIDYFNEKESLKKDRPKILKEICLTS